jgi:hypothetical protein
MARHLLLVHTTPVAGREDEYNAWYDSVHLREVLDVPEFVAAQRFAVSATPAADPLPAQPYLAIYEIETDDIDAALARLRKAAAAMDISATLDRSSAALFVATPLGERRTSTDGQA